MNEILIRAMLFYYTIMYYYTLCLQLVCTRRSVCVHACLCVLRGDSFFWINEIIMLLIQKYSLIFLFIFLKLWHK